MTMGVRNFFARRRQEKRVQRRSRSFNRSSDSANRELDAMLTNIGDRAYRIGNAMYSASQNRKGEGKQILKHWTVHGIGEASRALWGPSRKKNKTGGKA